MTRSRIRWLLIGLAGVALLAVLIPLSASVGSRAQIDKARRDARVIAEAVHRFRAQAGRPPRELPELLASTRSASGVTVGPFLEAMPTAPGGWTEFRLVYGPDDAVGITTTWSVLVTGVGEKIGVLTAWVDRAGNVRVEETEPASR